MVALPHPHMQRTAPLGPPLPLAYTAALLEQQRHIVRIYDLALPSARALEDLCLFRPQLVLVASAVPEAEQAFPCLAELGVPVVCVHAGLRGPWLPADPVAALAPAGAGPAAEAAHTLVRNTLALLDDHIDALPFPARHLLPLEQYPLRASDGGIRTPVLAVCQSPGLPIAPRHSAQIVAEIECVVSEQGISHICFPGPALNQDRAWLRSLLDRLIAADLRVGWEGHMELELLDAELLRHCREAGCEALRFELAAAQLLPPYGLHEQLRDTVQHLRALGIGSHALIVLAPGDDISPELIDCIALCDLDTVQFVVGEPHGHDQGTPKHAPLADLAARALERYRSSRSRRRFITRFGPQIGPMLWRLGRTGLLGRTFRRHATGCEETLALA